MFARLCQHHGPAPFGGLREADARKKRPGSASAPAASMAPPAEGKRRHSWTSDADFQLLTPPPRALGRDRAGAHAAAAAAPEPCGADSDDSAEAGDSGVEDAHSQSHALSTWYLDDLDGEPPLPLPLPVPDLVGPCRDVRDAGELSSGPAPHEDDEDDEDDAEEEEEEQEEEEGMGQRPSALLARSRPKLSLTWVLRGQGAAAAATPAPAVTVVAAAPAPAPAPAAPAAPASSPPPPPLPPRASSPAPAIKAPPPVRTLSEPSLLLAAEAATRVGGGGGGGGRAGREKHRHRRARTPRHKSEKARKPARFGYEIQDVDAFLTKASIEKPANIPVVLASPCVLYQTRTGGYQDEVALPLGMVVNAVFKNQAWLYVQTPHGEEGYVNYGACLPLGILPPPQRSHSNSKPPPCWETHTDIFPQPLGNRTDNEKLRDGTRSECGGARSFSSARRGRYGLERDAVSACGERSVDRLYLRAAANAKSKGTTRHTLLVIRSDYNSKGRNTLSVSKGDVVALVSGHLKDWFWVRSRDGNEGFIPSVVAGHGFL
ncbi:hypothetical protein R5R35_002817 [Gryllus longicercus]|uniref:SH3 domain-containing protein n=1 Tax=Gryllus longicercus TaxID=2509291 RepID=A0AAN9VTV4_9ORTH